MAIHTAGRKPNWGKLRGKKRGILPLAVLTGGNKKKGRWSNYDHLPWWVNKIGTNLLKAGGNYDILNASART
jgi:hypothetical protein